MSNNCAIVDATAGKMLEDKLKLLETAPRLTFKSLVRPVYDWALEQIRKYGKKIGADVAVLRDEILSGDLREYTATVGFYKLK